MTNYEEYLKEQFKNPKFKKEYEKYSLRIKLAYEMFQLRKKRKMSQLELAKKIGTTQSVVARMEAGEQNFSIDTLSNVANVLNCKMKIGFAN